MAKVPSDPVLSALPSAAVNQFVALRVVVIQLAVTLAVAGAAYAVGGRRAAFSSVVGGVIGVIPTIYLAMRVLRPVTGVSPERQVQAIYAAEAMKILLTGALFVMAFVLLDVAGLVVIGTYAATTLAYWIVLALPGVQAR